MSCRQHGEARLALVDHVLLGPHHPFEHRVDGLQVRRVRPARDVGMDAPDGVRYTPSAPRWYSTSPRSPGRSSRSRMPSNSLKICPYDLRRSDAAPSIGELARGGPCRSRPRPGSPRPADESTARPAAGSAIRRPQGEPALAHELRLQEAFETPRRRSVVIGSRSAHRVPGLGARTSMRAWTPLAFSLILDVHVLDAEPSGSTSRAAR